MFDGYVISVRQPWASRAVEGRIHTIPVRHRLEEVPKIVAIHASCSEQYGNYPHGCVLAYVRVISARDELWSIEGCEEVGHVQAKGDINIFKVDGLPMPKIST